MVEKYFDEDSSSPKKVWKFKLIVFFVFIVIFGLIVYTAFFSSGGFSFTGNAVAENVTDSGLISFDAQLTTPSLELDGIFEQVLIEGDFASVYVGSQKFALDDLSESYLIIENYEGKINFNDENISLLNGKAGRVVVNGIPVSLESGKSIKVYFGEVSGYDSLEIKKTAFVKKLSYTTSGKMILGNGKNVIDVSDEEVVISKFQGDLKSKNNMFEFDGYVSKVEVFGDAAFSVGG